MTSPAAPVLRGQTVAPSAPSVRMVSRGLAPSRRSLSSPAARITGHQEPGVTTRCACGIRGGGGGNDWLSPELAVLECCAGAGRDPGVRRHWGLAPAPRGGRERPRPWAQQGKLPRSAWEGKLGAKGGLLLGLLDYFSPPWHVSAKNSLGF